MKRLVPILAAALLAAPAQAASVFSDNFDAENGGASQFNYSSFANFTVSGLVDIIADGSFFNCPGPGSCVDLAGTPGPGQLVSNITFAFNAGDTVRLSVDLSGNQRGGSPDDFFLGFTFADNTPLVNYGNNFFGTDQIVFPNVLASSISSSGAVNFTDPFATRSIFFTAGSAGSLIFRIGTNGGDDFGPVIDNVNLDRTAVPEPASWAMMIAGFGLAGAALRRRATPALA